MGHCDTDMDEKQHIPLNVCVQAWLCGSVVCLWHMRVQEFMLVSTYTLCAAAVVVHQSNSIAARMNVQTSSSVQ